MNANKVQKQCRIFVRKASDRKFIEPGVELFGNFIDGTETLLLSPYKPDFAYSFPAWKVVKVSRKRATLCRIGENKAIKMPLEIVTMADIYGRTPFNATEMELLWNKRVLILGSGSGGSKLAIEFARAGVGNIILCDPDIFECANVSRHEGDLMDIGKPKVQLVAERIYRINPAIKVETYAEDIFDWDREDIDRLFMKADLVIASTDITAVQLRTNRFTQRLKLPCVFGGCYEEARGGEVFFTLPDEDMPCLECLRGGLKQPKRLGKIDYSTATGPEDYQGQPGLHAAVDFVTSIEIQIALAILLRESETSQLAKMIDPARNFLLIGGMMGENFYRFRKPFDIFYQPLKGPRKSCSTCKPI